MFWVGLAALALRGSPAPFAHRRHHGHHVQHSLSWLGTRPDDPPLANASFYNEAVLDHFASVAEKASTWSQRYYADARFWCGEGCPVFLYIGGEGPRARLPLRTRTPSPRSPSA